MVDRGRELASRERIVFVRHGARIEIVARDRTVLRSLEARTAAGPPAGAEPPDVTYVLDGDAERPVVRLTRRNRASQEWSELSASDAVADLVQALESDVHFQVALHARTGLFVHAGVVGWRGRAILVAGRSMSGKTSLVIALVRAGASYYSDEYAVLDTEGRVHPYVKPLSIRDADGIVSPVEVASLGGRAGAEALPLGLVLSTRYEHGAAWQPRRMTAGQTALVLLDNTVLAQTRPEASLRTMTRAAVRAIGLDGRRGEAALLVPALLRVLDAPEGR